MDAGSARPCGRGGRWTVRGLASAGLALWALCAAAQAAERVALVIGNGAYEHVKRLPNPGHDATDVGAAFERLGYAVTRVGDAGFDALRRGLLDFTRAASASEVAVVFYAGHGIEVDGRNFLVPVDARLARDQDVEFEAVPLALVTRAVGGARRLGLVVLDACRDNPFVAKLAKEGAKRSIGRGLARVAPAGGTLVAYAAEDGETADDGDGRNSPYTGALLRYLEEPGLEVGRLFRKVRAEVERTTGGSQTPVEYGKLPDADIYLASAAAPPPPPPGGAKEAFEVAERVGTVAAYRVVVEEFPGTTYARFAQAWIDKHAEEPLVVAGGEAADETTSSPPPSPEAVERGLGLSREERGQVQRGLAAAGHDPGPVDGMIGRGTREAIRRWQGAQGKPATGYLDADGAKALLALGERKAKEAEAAARRARAEAERKAREAEARRRAEAEARRKRARRPGYKFRDCPGCPEMVVVPAGRFRMGSPESEAGRRDDGREGPVHPVAIARPFAVGVHEVTRGEFARFVSATGRSMGNACWEWDGGWKERSGRHWRNPGFSQADDHPVVCVNWEDAQAYVRWLSRETGEKYRLLSEAEWEYVARAGTRMARYWGEGESGQCRYANGADASTDFDWRTGCNDGHARTAPVGSYEANGFGLHEVLGNVWEWVQDCWSNSYHGAPRDGSAWTSGDCGRRVLRGGSWVDAPRYLRSANRSGVTSGSRYNGAGLRVARTLTP